MAREAAFEIDEVWYTAGEVHERNLLIGNRHVTCDVHARTQGVGALARGACVDAVRASASAVLLREHEWRTREGL